MKRWRVLFINILIASYICPALAQGPMVPGTLLYSTDEPAASFTKDSVIVFTIKEISITGNAKTKDFIVLREVPFKTGQQYPLHELVNQFETAKKQLMNSGLFRIVVVSLKSLQGYDAKVSIDVKERWYLYPLPLIKTVDRNINEWVVTHKMNLNRVNYGIKVLHKNLRGRNDRFYLNVVNGYTKQLSISYDNLYWDDALKWSSNFNIAWGKNHEIFYNTVDDKRVAFKDKDAYVISFLRSQFEVSYRPAITTRHTLGIGYMFDDVADTLFKLNTNYAQQHNVVRYPEIFYRVSHINVDLNAYPRKGNVAEATLMRRGMGAGINLWQLTLMGSKFWPLNSKYTFNLRTAAMLKLPFKQPYVTKQLLGYGNMFMQGYEYNVMDGVAGGYAKTVFMRQILNKVVHIPSKRFERLNYIPVALYAKWYGNMGYTYNPEPGQNRMNNRLLTSTGLGLDIVLFNDFVIKVEYSLNQFGDKGLYLHRRDYF